MIFLFLNLGGGEIMVVLLFVLLFFGSKSIPDLARTLGKGLREIREATDNIKREIENGASDVTQSPKKVYQDTEDTIKDHKGNVAADGVVPKPENIPNASVPLDQQTDL